MGEWDMWRELCAFCGVRMHYSNVTSEPWQIGSRQDQYRSRKALDMSEHPRITSDWASQIRPK